MTAVWTLFTLTLGGACCAALPIALALVAVVALGNGARVLGERRAPRE